MNHYYDPVLEALSFSGLFSDHYFYHYSPLLEPYYGPMLKSTFSEASKLPTGHDIGLSWPSLDQMEGGRPSTAPFSQNICCFLSFTVSTIPTFQRVLALIYIWETFWEPQHSSARNISVDQTQHHQVGISYWDKRHPRFPLAGNICANNSRPWPTFSTSQCFLLSKDALSRWFRSFGLKDGKPSNVIFQGWRL